MSPDTLPSPSIGELGHTSWSEPFIQFFSGAPEYFQGLEHNAAFMNLLYFLWALFVVLAGCIIYLAIRAMQLQAAEYRAYYEKASAPQETGSVSKKYSLAWQEIVGHIKSESDADWKIAILEADSILSALLEDLGYPGDNLGERLKSVPKGEILSLDAAWTAHKMRNRIAHEGQSFKISRRELGETLAQFEIVFREFNYI
ncbi:MAG TPA: hypothetical protein VJB98_00520 [Candidatus Paceibacterota bacterium]